ncbi:hypothetical protein EDB84DRAFT_315518 [Lactarius hengduanensis]|nr:hypothetical protein EDB84DRAFT_315518 [Lactarius hengduanensis]
MDTRHRYRRVSWMHTTRMTQIPGPSQGPAPRAQRGGSDARPFPLLPSIPRPSSSSPASPAHPHGGPALACPRPRLHPLRPHLPLRRRQLRVLLVVASPDLASGAMSGAGRVISQGGELESRADGPLSWYSIIAVELVAIEELTSRDHSATSTLYTPPSLPGSWPTLTRELPPGPAQLYRLPLPPLCPTFFPFVNQRCNSSLRYDTRSVPLSALPGRSESPPANVWPTFSDTLAMTLS